jgi:hypothetical protein
MGEKRSGKGHFGSSQTGEAFDVVLVCVFSCSAMVKIDESDRQMVMAKDRFHSKRPIAFPPNGRSTSD